MSRGSRAAIVLAVVLAASKLAAAAAADEFSDFRIPDHRLLLWTGSLSSDARSQEYSYPGFSRSSGNWGATGSSELYLFHDSDPSQRSILLQAGADGSGGNSHFDQSRTTAGELDGQMNDSRGKRVDERWHVSMDQREYPWSVPFGWQLKLAGGGLYGQAWEHTTRNRYQSDTSGVAKRLDINHSVNWTYRYDVQGELRFGLGRVRDATGVLDARVFEARLQQAGVLAHPLSPVALGRLADIAYTQNVVSSVRERASKKLWQAVEQVLREDGALTERGLDAVAAERALEPYVGVLTQRLVAPIPQSPVLRMTGMFAGLFVAGAHSSETYRSDGHGEQIGFRNDSTLYDVLRGFGYGGHSGEENASAGARLEYYRPLGLRWQLDATSQATLPLHKHRQGLATTADIRLRAIVADRWMAEAAVQQRRSVVRTGGSGTALLQDDWVFNCTAALTVYLEDQLQLRMAASEYQERDARSPRFQRSAGVSLGLTYRLAGRYSGPGYLSQ